MGNVGYQVKVWVTIKYATLFFVQNRQYSTDVHKGNSDSWDHSPCSSAMASLKDALAKTGQRTFT